MDRFKYLSLGAVTVLVLVLVVGLAAIAGAVATAAIIDEVDDDRSYYKEYDLSDVSKAAAASAEAAVTKALAARGRQDAGDGAGELHGISGGDLRERDMGNG